MVVHRGVVFLRNLLAIGYKSDLAPKSDAYFPRVHLEGVPPRKPDTPGQRGTVDPPYILISEGGVKWHKPSSLPPAICVKQSKIDQPTIRSKDSAEDGPSTAYVFPNLSNWGM